MRKKLPVPIDQLLHSTSLPRPDFSSSKEALRHEFLLSAEQHRSSRWRRAFMSVFTHGGRAAGFASLGVVVILLGGAVIAQSDRAGQGGVFLALDRSFERARYSLTRGAPQKIDLEIGFADERMQELAVALESSQSPEAVEQSIVDVDAALTSIDQKLDVARIALDANEEHELSEEELQRLSAEFRRTVRSHQDTFMTQVAGLDATAESALGDITDLIENEVRDEHTTLGAGYLLELEGLIEDNNTITVFGDRTLEVVGLPTELVVGETVKLEGFLLDGVLLAEELKIAGSKIIQENDRVDAQMSAQLSKIDDVYGVYFGSTFIPIFGSLLADQQMERYVNSDIELRGTLSGAAINAYYLMARQGDDELRIGSEIYDTQNSADDSRLNEPVIDDGVDDSSADTENDDQADDSLVREVEGILKRVNRSYILKDEDSAASYIIQSNVDLTSYVGRVVEVRGSISVSAKDTIFVEEIEVEG